jgi:predicted permease
MSAAVLTGLLGWFVSAGEDRRQRAAVVLASAVSNNGNMGIPMSYFAFGESGMALATIYYVMMSFMSNTFGAAVASAGQAKISSALKQSLRVPTLYAAVAGALFNLSGAEIPQTLLRAVDLLADAAIPGMLILLGVQLRSAPILQAQGVILRSTAIRLLASPGIAWLLCLLLSITGVERNVVILQAAMPTAVMTSVLATEFDTAPRLVATIIFFSTVMSMITLSLVLWLLL